MSDQAENRQKLWKQLAVNIAGGFVAALMILASSLPGVNMPDLARVALAVIAAGLLTYLGLPWLCLGVTYLTLKNLAKCEKCIADSLCKRFPNSHYVRTLFDPAYRGETVYAATAFVLHKEKPDKLLWVMNETHHRWLPPGGRLLVNELPNEAIKEKVCSETAIPTDRLTFCEAFCPLLDAHIGSDDQVEPVQMPMVIQKELKEQRGGIPFHYDFLYVLETSFNGPPQGKQNPQWLSLAEVKSSPQEEWPFPNVLRLAERIMDSRGTTAKSVSNAP